MVTKTNYIVKTLSRTKRKDYENYVINRLYSELNDLDIKPVSQQYVKRNDNKYALIDLYFPQLNIGVEIDEMHHLAQEESDKLRFYDIVTAIKDYEEIRIKIFDDRDKNTLRDLSSINEDISNAVYRIKEKKKGTDYFKPWDNRPDIESAIENNRIRVSDNFTFNQEEVRRFFGRKSITQQSYYKLYDDLYIWFPGLAVRNGDKYIPYNKKLEFINIISNDGKQIFELIPDVNKFSSENHNRVVFLKMKDPIFGKKVYKFVGVFKMEDSIIKKEINGREEMFAVHNLISEEISHNIVT